MVDNICGVVSWMMMVYRNFLFLEKVCIFVYLVINDRFVIVLCMFCEMKSSYYLMINYNLFSFEGWENVNVILCVILG